MIADSQWMGRCFEMASRAKGVAIPNPTVAAILVDAAGEIAGTGVTAAGGRPHAESQAIDAAGKRAAGSTLYVTLEPCVPFPGKSSGSCAAAMIRAGIGKVVFGCLDPNPLVRGKGVAMLSGAGIDVRDCPEWSLEISEFYSGFGKYCARQRPLVTVKIAVSADGYATAGMGIRTKITGPESDAFIHRIRSSCDGILIGAATLLADNPRLTVRLAEGRSPERFIIGSIGKLPSGLHVLEQGDSRTTFIGVSRPENLPANAGFVAIPANGNERPGLSDVVQWFGSRGMHDVLIEPGPSLWRSVQASGIWDRLFVFRSPLRNGGGRKFDLWGLQGLDPAATYRFGPDTAARYEAKGETWKP